MLLIISKTTLKDSEWPSGKAAVDYYFIQDDGGMFKATMVYEPYFFISTKVGNDLCNRTMQTANDSR